MTVGNIIFEFIDYRYHNLCNFTKHITRAIQAGILVILICVGNWSHVVCTSFNTHMIIMGHARIQHRFSVGDGRANILKAKLIHSPSSSIN